MRPPIPTRRLQHHPSRCPRRTAGRAPWTPRSTFAPMGAVAIAAGGGGGISAPMAIPVAVPGAVAYLLAADNSIGPLVSRLRGAQQPVVRPRHAFAAPRSPLLARF